MTDHQKKTQRKPASEPIAVVGMGALFPHAQGLQSYWRLLRRGEDAFSDVPATHWAADDYVAPADAAGSPLDFVTSARGGFLDPCDFDPTEFGIPPAILEATDTAQLLALIVGKQALEDAGYGGESDFDRERASVILGVTGTLELSIPLGARLGHPAWRRALLAAGVDRPTAEKVLEDVLGSYVPWQENSFPGLLGNVVAGRIANRLNLKGANYVVDAACGSSLAAIQSAVSDLQTGRSDLVLTGGVDTFNDVFMFMCFTKTQALSKRGDVRAFSADADGTALGEGVGMVVLKRLADAERDGDRIHGVLKGIGASSDGKSQSIYAPVAAGQARALRNAYDLAGVSPASIGLVEAHGTGTRVGDAVEFQSLSEVFNAEPREGARCALGSVKSQIGHAKAAAGAAGMIKGLLALSHKVLPPTIKVGTPNPKIDLKQGAVYLNTLARPWFNRLSTPRRAAVSAFGFGGSNFHAVLEEASPKKTETAWDGSVELIAFSGPDFTAIRTVVAEWAEWLDNAPNDEAFAWRTRQARLAFNSGDSCRLLLVAEREADRKALFQKALAHLDAGAPAGVKIPNVYCSNGETPGQLGFVFPGQGSQYVGMGREMACVFPDAFNAIDKASRATGAEQPLHEYIYPEPALDAETLAAQEAALTDTAHAQPALGAVCRASLEVLRHFGLKPDHVAGHSFGEIVALYAADVLGEDVMAKVAALRGRLMGSGEGDRGTMLAVKAPLDELKAILTRENLEAVLANLNHPQQGILSGCREAIREAQRICEEHGWSVRPLNVSAAFHSPLMEKAREAFAEALENFQFQSPQIPVLANVTGEAYPDDPGACRRLLAEQLTSPVQFVKVIETMYEEGVRTFVEVGPKPVLTGLVGRILGDRPHRSIAVDASGGRRPALADLARSLAELTAAGYHVALDRWERAIAEPRPRKMSTPLVGANYRNPKPRAAQRLTLPDFPAAQSAPAPAPSPAGVQAASIPKSDKTMSIKHMTPASQPASAPPPPPAAAPGASPAYWQALNQSLQAMQDLQRQTAEAHQRFLDIQAQAHQTFHQMLGGVPAAMPSPPAPVASTPAPVAPAAPPPPAPAAPAAPAPVLAPAAPLPSGPALDVVIRDVVAELTGYPAEMVELDMDLEADLGIDSIKRVEILASVQARAEGLGTVDSSRLSSLRTLREVVEALDAEAIPAAAGNGHGKSNGNGNGNGNEHDPVAEAGAVALAMRQIVAELTGYPEDMIEMSMDLEADLGIDSIKRVEILAAMQDRAPALKQLDSSKMSGLRTLQEMLDAVMSDPAVHAGSGNGHGKSNGHGNGSAVETGAIALAMRQIVAELTGYPEDMVEMDMDLEADLGIDSIKRVEILAAMQERAPELKQLDSSKMSGLRTLQEMLDAVAASPVVSGNGNGNGKSNGNGHGAAPAAPSGAQPDDLTGALMAVVAELTGYPPEMLEPQMDLEADLGVDSIKRVEILAAVQERIPELPKADAAQLSAMRTLGEIAGALGAAPASSAPAAETILSAPSVGSTASTPVPRQTLALTPLAPLDAGAGRLPAQGAVAVAAEPGDALAGALAEALTVRGLTPVICELGATPPRDTPADWGGLIIVAAPDRLEGTLWPRMSETRARAAFRWVRCAAPALRAAQGFLATVSQLDGAFGLAGADYDPIHGALAGLAKTASLEWDEVQCRAFDVDPAWGDAPAMAAALLAELDSDGPLEVALTAAGRQGLTLSSESAPVDGELVFNEGDVVLVTGGARGVTAACALALAQSRRLTLVLAGRSPLPEGGESAALAALAEPAALKRALAQQAQSAGETLKPADLEIRARAILSAREIRANFDALRSTGARVEYRSVDVRDRDAVEVLVAGVRRDFGPIRGLIHGAGAIEDRRIEDKTVAQFERVFDTKVKSLGDLLDILPAGELSALVCFSSVSARFGNLGQVDYSMANEALNKISQRYARRHPACRVVSINWGPWQGGMVTPSLARAFEQRGVSLIPIEAGAAAMVEELRSPPGGAVEVVRGGGLTAPDPQPASAAKLAPVYTRRLSLKSNPYLASHQLDGRPVLPMAMMIEWFAHAALHNHPGLRFAGLRAFRVFRPAALEGPSLTLEVQAGRGERCDDGHYDVALALVEGEVVYARAVAELTGAAPGAPEYEIPAGLAAEPFPVGRDSLYGQMLFHGEAFHAIDGIEGMSAAGLAATLATAAPPADWVTDPLRPDWHTDPLLLDGCLQLPICWTQARLNLPSLPMAGAAYRQYVQRFPAGPLRAAVSVRESGPSRVLADVTVLGAEGNVLARFEGFEWIADAALAPAFGLASSALDRA